MRIVNAAYGSKKLACAHSAIVIGSSTLTMREPAPARVKAIFMLAWLVVLPCVLFPGLVSRAADANITTVLPREILQHAVSKLGFVDLYQSLSVSQHFRILVFHALKPVYGVEYGKKTYLNYTLLLRDFDMLVKDAKTGGDEAESTAASERARQIECLRSILQAEFGYCIRHTEEKLPQFSAEELPWSTWRDPRKVSAIPYILDQAIDSHHWIHYISLLVDAGQTDLLKYATFATITTANFKLLMSLSVPESVVMVAAKALEQNEPTSELAPLLAAVGFGAGPALLPENCSIPLFALCYIREKNVSLPKDYTLIDGLDGSSVPFWMHVFSKGDEEAEKLLNLVRMHGDDKSKRLASAYYGPVSEMDLLRSENDVYQAMLIHFRYSFICNGHVMLNYSKMSEEFTASYRTMNALLVYKEYLLVKQGGFALIQGYLQEHLVDRMYRLKDKIGHPVIRYCIQQLERPLEFLRGLIKYKADWSYVQFAWDCIRTAVPFETVNDHNSSLSLDALRNLMFEPSLPIDAVREMLKILSAHAIFKESFVEDGSILDMLMFWEAPENVIDAFLDLLPRKSKLHVDLVKMLLLLEKYSARLCQRLLCHVPEMSPERQAKLLKYRPNLLASRN